ncbi:MAG: hypothetical protein IPK79_05640 [Vampirovibrionales bacterium]|nr:hypothetical protein [Vampirovibrionales bacterium]
MVATTVCQDAKTQRMAALDKMPPVKFHALGELPLQVASYCRRLLLFLMAPKADDVVLPSILDLSGFFGCSERDVLAGFQELQRQGFEYELHGLDDPIRLWDPYKGDARKAGDWQAFSHDMLRPWESAIRNRGINRFGAPARRRIS